MTIGTWTYCPICNTRRRVTFDSSLIALHTPEDVSAHELRLASEHDEACRSKFAGKRS